MIKFTEPWPPGSRFGGTIKRSNNKRWFLQTNPKDDYVRLKPCENIVEIQASAYSMEEAARRIVESCEKGIRKLLGLRKWAIEDFENSSPQECQHTYELTETNVICSLCGKSMIEGGN